MPGSSHVSVVGLLSLVVHVCCAFVSSCVPAAGSDCVSVCVCSCLPAAGSRLCTCVSLVVNLLLAVPLVVYLCVSLVVYLCVCL